MSRDHLTCVGCGLHHERVEACGVHHCPMTTPIDIPAALAEFRALNAARTLGEWIGQGHAVILRGTERAHGPEGEICSLVNSENTVADRSFIAAAPRMFALIDKLAAAPMSHDEEYLDPHGECAAEIARLKAGAWCPCCLGSPISGKPCICGGTNSAQVAYSNLLRNSERQIADLQRRLEEANAELAKADARLYGMGAQP